MTKPITSSETTFDRQAGLLLVAVSAFVVVVFVNTILILCLPGDGWQMLYNDRDTGNYRLSYFMGDWETPLQVGDVVTAVGDQPTPKTTQYVPLPAPTHWVEGGTVVYTIRRDGQTMALPVTLHRLSARGILRGLANAMSAELAGWSWVLVGLLVFWLRPNNRAARLLLVASSSYGIVNQIGLAATTIPLDFAPLPMWTTYWVATFFWGWLFFPSLILLLLVFPLPLWPMTRHPRLTTTLFYAIPTAIMIITLLVGVDGPATALLVVEAVLIFAAAGTAVFQVFRQRHNRIARAQVSWVAFGIALSLGGTLLFYLLNWFKLIQLDTTIFWAILSWPVSLGLPVSFAIAILRYRLFDINVIIRKTLVYALLSGLLALVYFGSVVLLQTVFDSVAQERSPFIIVVSTLLIAALFAPLRQRVQAFIDRRFYRQKYDAQQILAQFAQTARDEVSLEALQAELVGVIQETMQPEALIVWLPEAAKK
ncbi:MAG: hypothetical protein H6659_19030 [Ardenticatenaceae bacterium]|nr:hypothetical protein [Ardenticatenaceae bacterium]